MIASPARDYPDTALWAQALHRQFPDVDGLLWMSRQRDRDHALVLFGDRLRGVLSGSRTAARWPGTPRCAMPCFRPPCVPASRPIDRRAQRTRWNCQADHQEAKDCGNQPAHHEADRRRHCRRDRFGHQLRTTLDRPLTSISESYFAGDWSRNIFVGFLFAISAFLLSYNGQTRAHMVLSRVAALAGLGVAMFPCQCHGARKSFRTFTM